MTKIIVVSKNEEILQSIKETISTHAIEILPQTPDWVPEDTGILILDLTSTPVPQRLPEIPESIRVYILHPESLEFSNLHVKPGRIFRWPQDKEIFLNRLRHVLSILSLLSFDPHRLEEPIFDIIPAGIVMFQDRRMIAANRYVERITGFPPEYYLSLSADDILKEVHPDDVAMLNAYFMRVYQEKVPHQSVDFRARHRNGHWVWLRATAHLVRYKNRPAFLFTYTDISEIEKEKEFLKYSMIYKGILLELSQIYYEVNDYEEYFNRLCSILSKNFPSTLFLAEWSWSEHSVLRVACMNGQAIPAEELPESPYLQLIHLKDESFTLRANFPGSATESPAFKIFQAGLEALVANHLQHLRQQWKLIENEELFRTLTEYSLAGVYIIQDGTFRYVNRALAEAFGYHQDEISGVKTPYDLVHPDDHELLRENLRKRFEGEVDSIRYRFRGVKKDGSVAHYEVLGRLVLYQGRPAIMGTLIEVTEQVRQMQELEQTNLRLQLIRDLSQAILSGESLESIARLCVKTLRAIIPCDRISIVRFNEALTEALVLAVDDVDGQRLFEGQVVPMDAFAIATFAKGEIQRTEFTDQITVDSPTGERLKKYGIQSVINVPIKIENHLLGCLNLGSRKPAFFTDKDIETAHEVAMFMALALQDAHRRTQLRESEERYRTLVEKNPFGIAIIQDGRIVYVNRTILDFLNLKTPHDLLHKPYYTFIHPDYLSVIDQYLKESGDIQVQPSWVEFKAVLPDGRNRWIRLFAHSIKYRGQPAHMIILNDITEHKDLESRYLKAQRLETVGKLAGGIAHDFNNLLTAIQGSADILALHVGDNEELRPFIESISDATARGAQLTQRLLIFSGKEVVQIEKLDIHQLIQSLEKLIRRLLPENIRLIVELNAEDPVVELDRIHIEQVILNLVVNAKDAMPNGGLLTIRTAEHVEEHPSTGLSESNLIIEVEDTGTGIPEEMIDRITEPFFTTKPHGTGLGLATVQTILQKYYGQLRIDSKPGEGARFTIILPRRKKAPTPHLIPRPQPVAVIVSDDFDVLFMIRVVLERQGIRTFFWLTPEPALQQIEKLSHLDLFIIENSLLTSRGPALIERLHENFPDIKPLILMNSDESPPHFISCETISRPFTVPQMIRAILKASPGLHPYLTREKESSVIEALD